MTTTTIKQATINHDNNLLLPKTPINQVYKPTFKLTTVYNDIMDTVVYNEIPEKIAKHSLIRLYANGNTSAYEILTSGTGIVDFDDIKQEILLALYATNKHEHLTIDDGGKLTINNADAVYKLDNGKYITALQYVYGACSRFMYQFVQKPYKHAYIEIDGATVDIFNTVQLSQYADFENVETLSLYQDFLNIVGATYPKDLARIEKVVKMRINGATFTECAKKLHCNVSTVTRLQAKISECAKILYR